jgi:hypothetical protein
VTSNAIQEPVLGSTDASGPEQLVTAPEGAVRRRSRIRPRTVLLAVTGALALAGCGASSATSPPANNGPGTRPPVTNPVVVVTVPDLVGHQGGKLITVKTGTQVKFELVSDAYHPNHTIAPWGTPGSSDQAVLASTAAPSGATCAAHATCTYFVAKSAGTANVVAGGPSGLLCSGTSTHCVAVMSILGQVRIKVTA